MATNQDPKYKIQQNEDGSISVLDPATNQPVPGMRARLATDDERARGFGGYVVEGANAEDATILRDTPDETIYQYGGGGAVWRYDKKNEDVQEFTAQWNLPDNVKRPMFGLLSQFADSPTDIGIPTFGIFDRLGVDNAYMPTAVEGVPAGLYSLYNLIAENSPLPEFQNDFLDQRVKNVSEVDAGLREVWGLTPPENALDVALEIGGSLLAPSPVKVPKGLSITGRQGGIINDATKFALESALPLRQTGLLPAAATQIPFGVALTEAVDAGAYNPEYTGIVDALDEATREQPSALDALLDGSVIGMPEDLQRMYASADEETKMELLDLLEQGLEEGAYQIPEGEVPAWRKPLAVLGAFAGLGLGASGVRNAVAQNAKQRLRSSTSLSGVEYNPEITTMGTRAIGGFIQADQPIREAVRRGGENDPLIRRLDRVTAPSLNTITQHTLRTGEFPNSAIRAQPLGATLQAFARDVDQAEWSVVTDGLLARNALDDLNLNKTQSAFNDKTPAELEQIALRLENDPKLSRYGDMIKQQYRNVLDYWLEQGIIDGEMHSGMIKDRPNFVHMGRNLQTENAGDTLFGGARFSQSARAHLNDVMQRATGEGEGVQVGRAADPIRDLTTYMPNAIRMVELNNIKKDIFDVLTQNRAFDDIIKAIPKGEMPKNLEGIHDVIINGQRQFYKVTDPALDAALRFNPNLGWSAARTVLGLPKRINEFFLTGPGNPFFALSAAAYDTGAGMALRPRGYDLGLISEGVNRVFPRSGGLLDTVKALDPTALVSAPVGAARLTWDEMIRGAASSLTDQLIRGDTILVKALGPQNAALLRDRLQVAYDNSIKAMMDRQGATTSNLLNTTDANLQGRAMADIAPSFYAKASQRAYQEALEGNASFFQGLLKGSGAVADTARANAITRVYMNLVRSLHEGFRYQAFATNSPKIRASANPQETAERLASQTRRISADVAQRGSGDVAGFITSTGMYVNPALQGLAQIGRMVKDQPVTTALNTATLLMMMTALQYSAAGDDPRIQEEIKNMTDDEQTRQIKTYGGLTIPVPPELRVLWGPYAAMLNEITGVNSESFDGNFKEVFDRWLDGDTQISEEGGYSIEQSFMSGATNSMPVQQGSFPVVNALAATLGIDLGFTRYTGSPQEIAVQEASPMGGDGTLEGDAISAQTMTLLEELVSANVTNYIRMGLDAERALEKGATWDEAVGVAFSRLADNTAKQAGPLRGLLFGNYERLQSANDTQMRLWYDKNNGLELARDILRKDIRQQYITGDDPRYAMLRNTDTVPEEYHKTALLPIGAVSADLLRVLRPLQLRDNELQDQITYTRNQRFSSIEERNAQINEYNEERKKLAEQRLMIVRQGEDIIRQVIGDPSFSFQNFDPEQYKNIPFEPVPQQ